MGDDGGGKLSNEVANRESVTQRALCCVKMKKVADEKGTLPENVKVSSVLKVPLQNGAVVESKDVCPETPTMYPVNGENGHTGDGHSGSVSRGKKRKAKVYSQVRSSWKLRSRTKEKLEASEPNDTAKEVPEAPKPIDVGKEVPEAPESNAAAKDVHEAPKPVESANEVGDEGGGECETNEVAKLENHETVTQSARCSEEMTKVANVKGLENVKMTSALENTEVPLHNDSTGVEVMDASPETPTGYPENGENGHTGDGSSGRGKKRKSKPISQVRSSWTLRSRIKENSEPNDAAREVPEASEPNVAAKEVPGAPEPVESAKEVGGSVEKKRRRKKKKLVKNIKVDELARMRSHLRYLFTRIKYEQSLIDAYSGEGWRGQSLEKLKPEKELQRAKSHILRYKLRIRELFQRLDSLLQEGKLPETLFDDKGEIDSEDIFCAKCGSKDLSLHNDIILCDGACDRGFHQFCLEPPLLRENIPPGDEDWLCPGCDCKADGIDMLNDFQETNISIQENWKKVFPEAATTASGKKKDDGSSSDDSEDDNYDPDKPDVAKGVEASSNESSFVSAPDALEATNSENYMGLPSEDSEDDDFDPASTDSEKQFKQGSSSSDFTSDSEDLGALLDDATIPGEDPELMSPSSDQLEKEDPKSPRDELSNLMDNSVEPVSGPRHVERLDYKKLYDETYGTSSDSSDEDYSGTGAPKKRRAEATASANKTPITNDESGTAHQPQKLPTRSRKRTQKTDANGSVTSPTVGSTSAGSKKPTPKRLGEAVTQRLYETFSINQYPERAKKEQLATELNITVHQINKWFENARWSARNRSKMEFNVAEKQPEPRLTTASNNTPSEQVGETPASTNNPK